MRRASSAPSPRRRERGLAHDERARPDDGADLELRRSDDDDARRGCGTLGRRRLLVGEDDDDRRLRGRRPRARSWPAWSTASSNVVGVDERERCPPAAWLASADRSAALAALRLTLSSKLRGTLAKTWPPPVNCGGADGAGAGAAGALLAPRLRAAAGDEAAALRRERAGALGVLLGAHRLVDEVRLDLAAEDRLVERDVLRLAALGVEHGCLRGGHQAAHLDEAVLRARDGALDEQQVLLGVDRVHRQPELGDALAAHPAGHLDALEDARRASPRRRPSRERGRCASRATAGRSRSCGA